MSSLVLELQREAMESSTDLANLLRKTMVIAAKLQLHELATWCRAELNSYPVGAEVPNYRMLTGELKVYNPYNGIWMQIQGGSSKVRVACGQSVAELQHLSQTKGMLGIVASPEIASRVIDPPSPPQVILQRSGFIGVLDAVRNSILDWTLRLEQDGVLGEGMTFSAAEKNTVMSNVTNYHIAGNFNGVLGNVSSQNAQIGSFGEVERQLDKTSVPTAERDELKSLIEALPRATPMEKKNLIARGLDWTVKNAAALGSLSAVVRAWFETAHS